MTNFSRRKLVTQWATPVVLGMVLPQHAQASVGLRWMFVLTVTEGTSVVIDSMGDTVSSDPLSASFTRELSFALTPEEFTTGLFVRELGSPAADYERFEVTIDTRTATTSSLRGTFDYGSFDVPFSFVGSGTFTAVCP